MAKKIKIQNIIESINKIKEITKIGNKYSICGNSKSSSINNNLANVLEHYLSYWIPICCEYYVLENNKDFLAKEVKQEFEEIFKIWNKEWIKEHDGMETIPIGVQKFNKKFTLECTKMEFSKKKHIIFDDNSSEHLQAFNVNNVNEIPKKNILVKLTIDQIHLRMGIKVHDKENSFTFEILNIEKKSKRNK